MAQAAVSARIATGLSFHTVADETASHAWKLLASGELEPAHRAVAVTATDITGGVLLVRELQIGFRDDDGRDPPSAPRLPAAVTALAAR